MRLFLILAASTALGACGAVRDPAYLVDIGEATSKELRASMRIFAAAEVPEHADLLGPVQGVSCMRGLFGRPASEDGAVDRLLYVTRLKGGNALTNVMCSGTRGPLLSPLAGCDVAIVCEGTGLRVRKKDLEPAPGQG
jgi:hypothetical protein